MIVRDLKLSSPCSWLMLRRILLTELMHEPGTDSLQPDFAVRVLRRFPYLCPALRRQQGRSTILVLGAVSGNGFCSTDPSRESARYRSVFGRTSERSLPLRFPFSGQTLHSGRRQRESRLENLFRFRSQSDQKGASAVRRYGSGFGSRRHRLCAGRNHYPVPLRRVSYYSEEIDKRFVFLTNDFLLPPLTVAAIYRNRWQVELFFKWIKQHLRIKRFFGTSPNCVRTQVWIAVAVYVLIAIIKKQLGLRHSLNTILQILSTTLFEKTPVPLVFQRYDEETETIDGSKQLMLFDI